MHPDCRIRELGHRRAGIVRHVSVGEPQASQLRPLGFGELLDRAIKLVMRNFKAFFLPVLVISLVVGVVGTSLLFAVFPALFVFDPTAIEGVGAEGPLPTSPLEIGALIGAGTVTATLQWLGFLLAAGACFRAIQVAYAGGVPEAGEAARTSLRRLHSVFWLGLIYGLVSFGLYIGMSIVIGILVGVVTSAGVPLAVAIVVGVLVGVGVAALWWWIVVRWSVALPALFTEDLRGTKALARSWSLTRGRGWVIFGLLIITVLLVGVLYVVVFALTTGLAFVGAESIVAQLIINVVAGAVFNVVSVPVLAALLGAIYYDLRVRKEGFDLELVAGRVAAGVPAAEGHTQP